MKRLKHAIGACIASKFAIIICILLLCFDIFAEFYFCDEITSILLGITTGLIATLTFYIYTRYIDSILSILEMQHITTLFLDNTLEMVNCDCEKKTLLRHTKDYQSKLSVLSCKLVYNKDYFYLLERIDGFVMSIKGAQSDFSKEFTEIAEARDRMLV